MEEKQEKIVYFCTSGADNAEKASICFAMANAGMALDMDVKVALQGKAVQLAQKGFTDHVPATGGFPALKKLISDYIAQGGEIHVCKPCMEERNIADSDLIEGAQVTAGGTLNIMAAASDAQMVY
ncbi:DsrE family protein [Desulfamplus magnetovallimortis]|uniref:DsrE family protein n=1 Tax=Desulfamplus magnetovallimortis TaxID=1246637 RepID=A0A1W1H6D8_9BACT|nr:DsrE family protein [Desulfamplus magnetovallimortis]SLM28051.1 DsrE family protein [Desulfamplus magnetovallimortis]